MDKRNTILLTVIAVATLLVAVVGATFAYYSVQVTNKASQVNVNASAREISVLTLETPNENLYLNVIPADMAKFDEDKHYFATTTENQDNVSNYATDKQSHLISKLSVGSDGDKKAKYTCQAQLKITLTTSDGSMGKELKNGDAKLYLVGNNVTFAEELGSDGLDISSILTEEAEGTKSKTYNITYEIDGNTKNEASIAADIELINKNKSDETGDQSYLAGKNLTMTFDIVTTGDTLDCIVGKING